MSDDRQPANRICRSLNKSVNGQRKTCYGIVKIVSRYAETKCAMRCFNADTACAVRKLGVESVVLHVIGTVAGSFISVFYSKPRA